MEIQQTNQLQTNQNCKFILSLLDQLKEAFIKHDLAVKKGEKIERRSKRQTKLSNTNS